jgi:hypothetical protein
MSHRLVPAQAGTRIAFIEDMPSQVLRLGASFATMSLLFVVYPEPSRAATREVRRGDSLQAALNAASPGDVIVLEAGAEFVGNFTLPVKSGDRPIVVRSSFSSLLPPDGTRIQPSHAPLLATIRSPNNASALKTAAGTSGWDLRYLEFASNVGGYGEIIQLGDGSASQNAMGKVPRGFVLSHLYIHGDPLFGQKRGIALNAADVTIRDSYISDCKGVGVDTQAIAGWNGPGPYVIENNYLEATGENVLFGGADPSIQNLVPENIVFRRNHVSRPMSWREPIIGTPKDVAATPQGGGGLAAGRYAYRVIARRSVGQGTIGRSSPSAEASADVGHAGSVRLTWAPVPDATEYRVYGRSSAGMSTYWTVKSNTFVDTGAAGSSGAVPTSAGTLWSVKNLFELKNARHVVVADNVMENHWKESQPGYSIVLTPRNSNSGCPWCVVEDVRIENNIVRHVAAGINVLGYDMPSRPTLQTRDLVIRNNLFYDMGSPYDGNGWFLLIGDGPDGVVVDHNTIAHTGSTVVYVYGGSSSAPRRVQNFRFTNNATSHGSYGINGEFFAYGNGIIGEFFPGATVKGNFLAGGPSSRYPAGNRFTGTFAAEFVNAAGGDFTLKPASPLRGAATDGGDIGVDVGTVVDRTSNVELGFPGGLRVNAPANVRVQVTK